MAKALVLFLCGLAFSFNCLAYELESYFQAPISSTKTNLNIVFCPLHYTDQRRFLNDAVALTKRLNQVKPFDEFIAHIRFHYIRLSLKEANALFRITKQYPYLEVRQNFLDDLRTRIKSNYKLIILDASGGIAAAELSTPKQLSLVILGEGRYSSLEDFANGFLHEVGHALGLRDEGLDGEAACPPGPPNCAINMTQAQQWWGDLTASPGGRVGYLNGCCGNRNYIRPTIASLMNKPTRANDFGPVNERYLRKALKVLSGT